MARSGRPPSNTMSRPRLALRQLLGGEKLDLTLYAALRKVEVLFRRAPRLGESLDPTAEPVRLGQDPSLAFRSAALTAVREADSQRPARLALGYLGLYGPHGPLPSHFTQYIEDRQRRHRDSTWIAFLDVFHQRLLSLFFRAWANAQPTVNRDRPHDDRYARYLGAMIGQHSGSSTELTERDQHALFAATHFIGPTRHAEGLRKVLQLYFGVPIEIEEFVGQWLDIPPQFCWQLANAQTYSSDALGVLGNSSRLGTQVWDRQAKFRVIIGPVALDSYGRFLPGGEHYTRLIAWVQHYAGLEAQWDARLILQESDRCGAVLGVSGALGRTTNLAQGDGGTTSFESFQLDPLDQLAQGGSHA